MLDEKVLRVLTDMLRRMEAEAELVQRASADPVTLKLGEQLCEEIDAMKKLVLTHVYEGNAKLSPKMRSIVSDLLDP